MELTLKNTTFKYFLYNNLENQLKSYHFLYFQYINWKNKYYTNCSCCQKLIDKQYVCQICHNFHYCLSCWDNYTYFCFYCNKDHCFICNIKQRACKNCYY